MQVRVILIIYSYDFLGIGVDYYRMAHKTPFGYKANFLKFFTFPRPGSRTLPRNKQMSHLHVNIHNQLEALLYSL